MDSKEKEIKFWKMDLKTIEEFFNRVSILKDLGIPDTRETRMQLLNIMASNDIITKMDQKQFVEYVKKNISKGGTILHVSSGNERSDSGDIDRGSEGEAA